MRNKKKKETAREASAVIPCSLFWSPVKKSNGFHPARRRERPMCLEAGMSSTGIEKGAWGRVHVSPIGCGCLFPGFLSPFFCFLPYLWPWQQFGCFGWRGPALHTAGAICKAETKSASAGKEVSAADSSNCTLLSFGIRAENPQRDRRITRRPLCYGSREQLPVVSFCYAAPEECVSCRSSPGLSQ